MRSALARIWLGAKRFSMSARCLLLSRRWLSNWFVALARELFLSAGRPVTYRLRNGFTVTVRAKSYDKFIVQEICTGAYDIALSDLPAAPTVIDAGAHIGVFSTKVLSDFPSARLFCIEPIAENLQLLEKNLADNQMRARAAIIRGVLAGKSGEMKIYGRENHSAGFNLYMPTASRESVRSYTLEEIFESNGIDRCDLLKLDIEGSEYEVLFGAPKDILARIDRIVMEYHPFPKEMADPQKLARFLEKQGFIAAFYAKKLMYAKRKDTFNK